MWYQIFNNQTLQLHISFITDGVNIKILDSNLFINNLIYLNSYYGFMITPGFYF